jgi:hypothetical protein
MTNKIYGVIFTNYCNHEIIAHSSYDKEHSEKWLARMLARDNDNNRIQFKDGTNFRVIELTYDNAKLLYNRHMLPKEIKKMLYTNYLVDILVRHKNNWRWATRDIYNISDLNEIEPAWN